MESDDVAVALHRLLHAEPVMPPQIDVASGSYLIKFRIPPTMQKKWETSMMDAIEDAVGDIIRTVDISKSYYRREGKRVQNWRIILRFVPKTPLEMVAGRLLESAYSSLHRPVDLPGVDSPEGAELPLYGIPRHRTLPEPGLPGPTSNQVNGWGPAVRRIKG